MKFALTLLTTLLVGHLALAGDPIDPEEGCKILLSWVHARADENLNRRGKEVLEVTAEFLENGTGATLPDSGRRAEIPHKFLLPLINAFDVEFRDATNETLRKGRAAAPVPMAVGNLGHMTDHLQFYASFAGDFQTYLGIDPLSLKLAIVAHDIGKGFLNEFLDAYVKFKTKDDFLKRFVLAHEFHSLANIPKVVRQVLVREGVDLSTEAGQKLVFDVSFQIIEMVRYHNGVSVVADMEKRYPDLDPKEIEMVLKAWWPENYRRFTADFSDVGLKSDYGIEPLGAIPAVLNFADRATLTSPSAPAKLALQNFSQIGFTKDLFTRSMIDPARQNIPLILAQASQLKPYLNDASVSIYDIPPVKEAQFYNSRVLELGQDLLAMNDIVRLKKELHLKDFELPMTADQRKNKMTGPAYLYFSESFSWYRVEGSNPNDGVTEIWNSKNSQWAQVTRGGHPVAHLMKLIGSRLALGAKF